MNHYTFDEIAVDMKESFHVTITEKMMQSFLEITGDYNPLHNDAVYARTQNYFDKVVFGMLTASLFSTLAGVYLPGEYSLIHRVEAEFPVPVFIGDQLTICGIVRSKNDTFHTIELRTQIVNQSLEKVARGKMRIGVTQ